MNLQRILCIVCLNTYRPLSWIKEKKMGSFLAVTQGSEEDPWFLEVKYNGGADSQSPLALVGKGLLALTPIGCLKVL